MIGYDKEYLAVQWSGSDMPSLMTTKDRQKLWWGEGSSYCYLTEECKIVKSYGTPTNPDDALEVWYQYAQDWPPQIGVVYSAGWLSPDGTYYPCAEWAHDSTISQIEDYLQVDSIDTSEWLRVSTTGIIWFDTIPTQAQLDTLFTIASLPQANQEPKLKITIMKYLKYHQENES